MFQPSKRLGIVFKISERCNLKCEYCYFFFSGDETWKKRPPLVTDDTVHGLGRFCSEAARSYDLNEIVITLHGGEPLLMRKSRFDWMCRTLRSYESGFRFIFHLQTNGALIDHEWVSLLANHRVGVGISLDGDKSQNDVFRLDKRGQSSYDRTVNGLRLLQTAATNRVCPPPGLLGVINPDEDGARAFNHFASDLGAKQMNFLVPDYSHDSGIAPGYAEGVGTYLNSVTRAWAKLRKPGVRIRFLHQIITLMASDEDEMRKTVPHDFRHLLVVSSDGRIGPEDTLHGLAERFRSMPDVVGEARAEDVFESDVWAELEETISGPDACQSCQWLRVCRGGNPANRFSSERGFNNPSIFCTQLKSLYQNVRDMLEANSVPKALIDRNLEYRHDNAA